ncbi:MAG: hypothetical protein KAR42_11560 [candidate division Zixibacteria bacterium]|nr:hypothetical protein [candidate division Zixibacteria bacterium]
MKNNIFILIILLFTISAVNAEELETPTEAQRQQINLPPKSPIVDKISRLMRLGEYERAADLAQMYLSQEPGNLTLKTLLAGSLESAGRYDELVLFLEQRVANEKAGFPLYRLAGRAYLLAGNTDSARSLFYRAANFALQRESSLRLIAKHWHTSGKYELAIEFIDSIRVLSGNPQLMANQMGDALVAQKEYGRAAIEYLDFMEKDSISAAAAENRLISMISYPESVDTVMAILSSRIQAKLNSRRLSSTYGRLLLEQDKFDEARSYYQEMDSLRSHRGSDVLYFVRECNNRGQYAQAIQAGEYMLQKYPQSPWFGSIQFSLAQAKTKLGLYSEALQLYHEVADKFTRASQKSDANLQIGLLYKDYIRDFDKAREFLGQVMLTSPGTRYDVMARFSLADMYVYLNNLDSASAIYRELLTRNLNEDFAEQIEYIQAMISVFTGDFSTANGRFRKIISRYPKGMFVNDAIQYTLIISEAGSTAKNQMDLFSAAEYHRYTKNSDSLEFYLVKICLVDIPTLAPISYLRLAELRVENENTKGALASLDSLSNKYTESYFTPYGHKLKADILLPLAERKEEAITIYRELLENFPKYPFAAEVRSILRKETDAEQI